MKLRNDLKSKDSPPDMKVIQLTEEEIPCSHVYMESQVFTPDSKRFILRSGRPHGSDRDDPEHRFFVCDIEAGCSLTPVTEETGAKAPSVSPDGKYLYYFVDETDINCGRLILKRVSLEGAGREELFVLDSPFPETGTHPSRVYVLSTISSDGKKIAISCFLGDGERENGPWGILVFDVEQGRVSLPLIGRHWSNTHLQYCRSTDPSEFRLILVQQNHGYSFDRMGERTKCNWDGIDVHVVTDDGKLLMDIPVGMDKNERCQGHQCWRGKSALVLTSTISRVDGRVEARLIQSEAFEHQDHLGKNTPNSRRNDLSRHLNIPGFYHFATDTGGDRIILDGSVGCPIVKNYPEDRSIYIAGLPEEKEGALDGLKFLLDPLSAVEHIHPFLSPDGKRAFFNSDETGISQAYMIENLSFDE